MIIIFLLDDEEMATRLFVSKENFSIEYQTTIFRKLYRIVQKSLKI